MHHGVTILLEFTPRRLIDLISLYITSRPFKSLEDQTQSETESILTMSSVTDACASVVDVDDVVIS